MSGDEGFLTLATGMRVSPKPIERILFLKWGISDLLGCSAYDRCRPEQMRGTCEPLKGSFPFREGRRPENLLKEYAKFSYII